MVMLKYLNLAVAAVTAVGAVFLLSPFNVAHLFQSLFFIAAAAAIGFLEFRKPAYVGRHANFLFSFIGRAVLYIYLGSQLLYGSLTRWILGLALVSAGGLFVSFAFSGMPLPESMQYDPELPIDTL